VIFCCRDFREVAILSIANKLWYFQVFLKMVCLFFVLLTHSSESSHGGRCGAIRKRIEGCWMSSNSSGSSASCNTTANIARWNASHWILADSGYQGIREYHERNMIPMKKGKNRELSEIEKAYNIDLSRRRIFLLREDQRHNQQSIQNHGLSLTKQTT